MQNPSRILATRTFVTIPKVFNTDTNATKFLFPLCPSSLTRLRLFSPRQFRSSSTLHHRHNCTLVPTIASFDHTIISSPLSLHSLHKVPLILKSRFPSRHEVSFSTGTTKNIRKSKDKNDGDDEITTAVETKTTIIYSRGTKRLTLPRVALATSTFGMAYWAWYVFDFHPAVNAASIAATGLPLSDPMVGYVGMFTGAVTFVAASFYPTFLVHEIRSTSPVVEDRREEEDGRFSRKRHHRGTRRTPRKQRRSDDDIVPQMSPKTLTIHTYNLLPLISESTVGKSYPWGNVQISDPAQVNDFLRTGRFDAFRGHLGLNAIGGSKGSTGDSGFFGFYDSPFGMWFGKGGDMVLLHLDGGRSVQGNEVRDDNLLMEMLISGMENKETFDSNTYGNNSKRKKDDKIRKRERARKL